MSIKKCPPFAKEAEAAGNRAAVMAFGYAMKAEEVHARLYQEALENLDETEEVFYYLCPICGNIENPFPKDAASVVLRAKSSSSINALELNKRTKE